MVVGASLHAQVPLTEVNLFGDDFPSAEVRRVPAKEPAPPAAPAPDQQTLLFHHGRQLRGELEQLTKDEVVWRRKDASDVLRFPRAEVRRVVLGSVDPMTNPFGMNVEYAAAKGVAMPLLATVKLPGSDWLRGALTSADGDSFSLAMKGGTPLTLARGQVEWLHFDAKPAPVSGLGVGPLALEGWLTGGTPRIESKDGTLTLHGALWIGRALAAPQRFEVAFEVPAEGEDDLRLWLQPFTPRPNSYGTGTIQFVFGRQKLKWLVYHDSTKPTEVALPAETQAETGPVRYRVLYDGPEQRVILLRNGRELGKFSLKPKLEKAGANQLRTPRGFCFDRESRNEKTPLQFRQLSVRPWDGALPETTAAGSANQDRLSAPELPGVAGRLEKVRETELVFGGKTVPLGPDTFVQFPQTPTELAEAEALLSFGEQGEVSLAELQIGDGKVRGRSVFAPALELATGSLQAIAFAPREMAPPAGDLLVFKNGDELSGALVSATTGRPLRWRLASGSEIEFQTDRIAGVRLTSSAQAPLAGMVELRSGERLRGATVAFDEQQVRWQHPLLGELILNRNALWRLYPTAGKSPRDGGQEPERWLRDMAKAKRMMNYSRVRSQSDVWLALDGRFILRPSENSSGEQTLGPACELSADLDRFELRLGFASPSHNPGTLHLGLVAPDGGGVSINLSSYYIYLYVRKSKSGMEQINRELTIRDKIGESARMLNLRAFVNRPAGTIDLFLNGHYLGRIGQTAAERVPGIGRSITMDIYSSSRAPVLFSEVSITPWSGELPRFGVDAPMTVLANGDVATGAPAALRDGRWHLESEIGPLDLPAEKVQAVEFGGEMQPVSAAGRVRLVDGSALLVTGFAWKDGALTAQHATLGELRIPGHAVSELIYDPAPARPPMLVDPKNVARKGNDAPEILLP